MTGSGPLVWWTGWDLRRGAAADPSAADPSAADGFAATAPPDPAPMAGGRYELIAVAARGFRPPQFLSTDPVGDDTEADGAPGIGSDGEGGGDHPGLRSVWRLLYRRIAETGPPETVPYGIYLLGVDPPEGLTDDDLEVFNRFYTDVHLPEVAERRQALRASRYELVREDRAPYRGAPRYLAVYEVDERSASNRRHTGPKYSAGPEVWQRHTTPWRLWYRRLSAGGATPTP